MAGRTGRRRALRALAALTIAAAATTAACSPLTTQRPYAPSDGVRATLGDELTVENLLILTEGEGEPALVLAGLTNRTAEQTTVQLTFGEGIDSTVTVGGGSTVLLDPLNDDGETIVIDASPVPPGAVLPVTISTPSGGSTIAQVPVLDGTLAPYGDYLEVLDSIPAE